jgi:hypothetical protein
MTMAPKPKKASKKPAARKKARPGSAGVKAARALKKSVTKKRPYTRRKPLHTTDVTGQLQELENLDPVFADPIGDSLKPYEVEDDGIKTEGLGEAHSHPNLAGTYLERAHADARDRAEADLEHVGRADLKAAEIAAATFSGILQIGGVKGFQETMAVLDVIRSLARYSSSQTGFDANDVRGLVDAAQRLEALKIEQFDAHLASVNETGEDTNFALNG